jgi:hypothetical protein
MGIPVMVLGESGTGKTTSLRNINPEETFLIQAIRKPLPFRSANWKEFDQQTSTGSIINSDDCGFISQVISHAHNYGRNKVVIDDFQYIMANEFMRRSGEVGFTKFTEIAKHVWELVMSATNAAPNLRVYFLSHTETSDLGKTKAKTIGKLLDEKITLEGMFTVVLRSLVDNNQFQFSTQNSGMDTVKSPMGMFESRFIENDLNTVDQTISQYYGV